RQETQLRFGVGAARRARRKRESASRSPERSQDGVDKPGRARLLNRARELHGFVEGGMRRNPIQMFELIRGESKDGPHARRQLVERAVAALREQRIELGAPAERARCQFDEESPIALIGQTLARPVYFG